MHDPTQFWLKVYWLTGFLKQPIRKSHQHRFFETTIGIGSGFIHSSWLYNILALQCRLAIGGSARGCWGSDNSTNSHERWDGAQDAADTTASESSFSDYCPSTQTPRYLLPYNRFHAESLNRKAKLVQEHVTRDWSREYGCVSFERAVAEK